MRRVAALAALAALGACGSPPPPPAGAPAPSVVRAPAAAAPLATPDPALAPRLAELDNFLQQQLTEHHFPGLVAGVVTRDGLVWSKAYGERDVATHAAMTTDTLCRIGSVTKVLTALAVLKLRDDGALDLDAPVAKWIPELASAAAPTSDSPPITLRHLMTHTSGLPREPQLPDPYGVTHEVGEAELVASLRTTKLDWPTGTRFSYSNLGAALEGLVIARASKQPYAAFMQAQLLRPLGMATATLDRAQIPEAQRASSYTHDGGSLAPAPVLHEGATAARGQIYASVPDLARLVQFELLAWPPRDGADPGPVRRSTVRESQRTMGPFGPGASTKGAGWFLDATPRGEIVEHGGAGEGFMSDVWLSTTANLGFVVMINDDDAELMTVSKHAQEILLSELPSALDVAAKLLDDPTDATAERLVDPAYLKGMHDRGSLPKFAAMRAKYGACVVSSTTKSGADGGPAAGLIACGDLRLEVTAHVTDDGQLDALLVKPSR